MELSDLQLGDVVEFSNADGHYAGKGAGTVIGLDPTDPRYPVMLGWNEGEATLRPGKDSYVVAGTTYLPNAQTKFANSLWMALADIVRKVGASSTSATRREHPCKQCRKMNDHGIGSCWWCGASNPTT